jgi:Tfp pilus assembly protein FimV
MNLTELEQLAKAAIESRGNLDTEESIAEHINRYGAYNEATNPETILRLIELVREMGEALEIALKDQRDGFGLAVKDTERVLAKYKEWMK